MSTAAKWAAGNGQEHSENVLPEGFASLVPRLVHALYRGVLGREADAEGLANYSRKFAENADLAEVLADLLGSDEYRSRSIEALSRDLVSAAYRAILGRDPDPEGFEAHHSRLRSDRDIAAFLSGIVESDEFRNNMTYRLVGECAASGGVQALSIPVATPQLANVPSMVFTHHKCATTWMMNILDRYCAASGKRLYNTRLSGFAHPRDRNFDVLLFLNSEYNFCSRTYQAWLDSGSRKAVHIIRNPLDIVVSAYYSHLATHEVREWPELAEQRKVLRGLDKTSGMIATWVFLERSDFDAGVVGPLYALRRWKFDDPRIKTLRMEDLVVDPEFARSELQSLLDADLAEIISDLAFEKISGGRPAGVIDNQSHYRAGVPHQWLHEMDSSLARAIYQKYKGIFDAYYPEVDALLRSGEPESENRVVIPPSIAPHQRKKIIGDASRREEWPDGSQLLKRGLRSLSDVLDTDRLVNIASGVQTRGAVAVSFASEEYLELALEWSKAIRHCNLFNFLVVCGDSSSYDTLAAAGIPAIRAAVDTGAMPHDFRSSSGFTSKGLAMCALKFPVVRAIISQGLDVVLSDIDAIWLRDPFLFFPKDVDLAFQRVVVHPPAVVELWGFSLCSGFVYFHDSPATRSYLEACISWNSKVQSDQVAANLALLEADMRWDLPENYIQQYPIGVEMAKSQFSAFSKISFQGVSGVHHLKALALPPEQFWRHPFIRPRNMVICHPNSPKSQAEKLQILSRWMDRRSDTAQCSQKRS